MKNYWSGFYIHSCGGATSRDHVSPCTTKVALYCVSTAFNLYNTYMHTELGHMVQQQSPGAQSECCYQVFLEKRDRCTDNLKTRICERKHNKKTSGQN